MIFVEKEDALNIEVNNTIILKSAGVFKVLSKNIDTIVL